jgi:hypothetical protein
MIFLSILSSSPTVIAAASEQGPSSSTPITYRKYVIYYGSYYTHDGKVGPEIDRIINAKPEFVVSPHHSSTTGEVNLKPEIMKLFHDNNVKVMVYVATGYASRDLGSVFDEIKTAFDSSADGVMLDEVAMLQTQLQVDYYKKIYDYAKSFGKDKVVIANPGSVLVNEKVMTVSDIVCFEHQWRLAPEIDWFSKYPPTRFIGVSSNDIKNVMGYNVDAAAAVRDTIEAWQSGIGYHYSTDSYILLPSWFEEYQNGLGGYSASGAKLHELTVNTVDSQGKVITGLWIEVKKNDRVVLTSFSPAKFMVPEGNYQVIASDYQNYIFEKWQDGVTTKYHNITVSVPAELSAIYRNELADLRVESFDNLGHTVKGMQISIIRDGNTVATGFTPLYLRLPLGKYTIDASSYNYYQFAGWDNNSNSSTSQRQIDFFQNTKLAAYYNNTIAGKVGEEVFSCQDDEYKQQVVDQILKGGPLAGALELHMQRSLAISTGCISAA